MHQAHSSLYIPPRSVGIDVVPPSTERILAAVQAKADGLTPGGYLNLEYQATADCLCEGRCNINVQAMYTDLARTYNTTEEARILDLIAPQLCDETKGGCGCPLFEGNFERVEAALNKLPDNEFLDMFLKMREELKAERQSIVEQLENMKKIDTVREEQMNMFYASGGLTTLRRRIEKV